MEDVEDHVTFVSQPVKKDEMHYIEEIVQEIIDAYKYRQLQNQV